MRMIVVAGTPLTGHVNPILVVCRQLAREEHVVSFQMSTHSRHRQKRPSYIFFYYQVMPVTTIDIW
jgi:UDP:flavonoid glycosyltransferase YjiC (YdhE family)